MSLSKAIGSPAIDSFITRSLIRSIKVFHLIIIRELFNHIIQQKLWYNRISIILLVAVESGDRSVPNAIKNGHNFDVENILKTTVGY